MHFQSETPFSNFQCGEVWMGPYLTQRPKSGIDHNLFCLYFISEKGNGSQFALSLSNAGEVWGGYKVLGNWVPKILAFLGQVKLL